MYETEYGIPKVNFERNTRFNFCQNFVFEVLIVRNSSCFGPQFESPHRAGDSKPRAEDWRIGRRKIFQRCRQLYYDADLLPVADA